MAFVSVPKDLTKVKNKIIFNLTKRQLICFGIAAADGDFCIAIYNPSSKGRPDYLKRACEILLRKVCPERMCGYVRNIGREGTEYKICTLEQLKDEQVDMFTTVFIGNSQSHVVKGKLVTGRNYHINTHMQKEN